MPSFTERYHELTKYRPETIDRLGAVRWEDQPEPFKDVPPGRKVDLVPHLKLLFAHLEAPPDSTAPWLQDEALPALARLLYFTLGLTARLSGGGTDQFLRAAPSAGGLYPTEVYVAVRGFADLPSGIYHYHSQKSALIPVWEGDFSADLRHHFLDHPAAAGHCLFLFTGIYNRGAWRYKERAYRRILLDTGHAAANLQETALALGLSTTLLGGFYDAGLEELLFLSAKEEFPLLGVAVGQATPVAAGQRPGALPAESSRRVQAEDSLQVQQNACERLYADLPLRSAVPTREAGIAFDAAGFNPQSVILRRRSTRKFNGGSLLLKDAEDMLRFAFRAAAGEWSLAPGQLKFYVAAFAIEGRTPGLYAVDPSTLAWTALQTGDFREALREVCLGQDLAAECAWAWIAVVDIPQLVSVYGDRGYRYACMDAGQIGERIQLWAVHRDLGSSGIGGYYDDRANALLNLPLEYGILYITLVGVPEE